MGSKWKENVCQCRRMLVMGLDGRTQVHLTNFHDKVRHVIFVVDNLSGMSHIQCKGGMSHIQCKGGMSKWFVKSISQILMCGGMSTMVCVNMVSRTLCGMWQLDFKRCSNFFGIGNSFKCRI